MTATDDLPTAIQTHTGPPLSFVSPDQYRRGRGEAAPLSNFPSHYRDRLVIDVVHDGDWIPEEFLRDKTGGAITLKEIRETYIRERDWGASLVAERLASRLGLAGYARVNVARVLMDFGRFPGCTPRVADHLHRFAINYPFSERLGHLQKQSLMENYYDAVSIDLEQRLNGKLLKLAIHTYDQYNRSGTERPPVSLMTRSIGYQTESEMPWGLFDPLYPDILGEFTADRVLRDRISLTLEKAGVPVAHNYPYCLPEGSLEVRYQVWTFFNFLRHEYERGHPDSRDNLGYTLVWDLLMDTNLRSSNSEALRSYLHMFRRAPDGREDDFRQAGAAYDKLSTFLEEHGYEIVEAYRFSPKRPSSIAIEVRKDIVCELGADGLPTKPRWDHIEHIGDTIATAISVYLSEDRPAHEHPREDLERSQPWYSVPR